MYFCKKKRKHIFLFHASHRLHDQRKKKKPEVKADPKVQELQQRLEARKAGRLKRLFDNSDGENDNKLQTLSGKSTIQAICQCSHHNFTKVDRSKHFFVGELDFQNAIWNHWSPLFRSHRRPRVFVACAATSLSVRHFRNAVLLFCRHFNILEGKKERLFIKCTPTQLPSVFLS